MQHTLIIIYVYTGMLGLGGAGADGSVKPDISKKVIKAIKKQLRNPSTQGLICMGLKNYVKVCMYVLIHTGIEIVGITIAQSSVCVSVTVTAAFATLRKVVWYDYQWLYIINAADTPRLYQCTYSVLVPS
jgi:hypothetical protein